MGYPNEHPTIEEALGWYDEKMSPEYKGAVVLYGFYDQEMYEGYSRVIYKTKDNKVFEVNGSHCSCYGLEEQWQPEEVDLKELRHRAEFGTYFQYDKEEILRIIFELEGVTA